tara:strand:+ start:240 stop:494 length:255 start_codon:yes stop_codon:yes gene_type:complete
MSVNLQQFLPLVGGIISVGGLIFKMGQHAEKLNILDNTVQAQEKKVELNHNIINDIHNDLSILRNDISYVREDIHEIKNKLENN